MKLTLSIVKSMLTNVDLGRGPQLITEHAEMVRTVQDEHIVRAWQILQEPTPSIGSSHVSPMRLAFVSMHRMTLSFLISYSVIPKSFGRTVCHDSSLRGRNQHPHFAPSHLGHPFPDTAPLKKTRNNRKRLMVSSSGVTAE